MFAIIKAGGRQVKVSPGSTVTVDRLGAEAGAAIAFSEVLLVEKDGGEVLAGTPVIAGARVTAVVEGEERGPKIRVFKKKRRKGMRRTRGHRSTYSTVKITGIEV